jgi:hypothetical protein
MNVLPAVSRFGDLAVGPQCNSGSHNVLIPTDSPSGGYWSCQTDSKPVHHIVFSSSLYIATLWYYLATLVFELPVLYLFGFRSKKAIITALLANVLTVFSFHFASSYCSQSGKCNLAQGPNRGFIFAETLIFFVEALVYWLVLRREIRPRNIIWAALLANLSSAIIGGLIVNNVFGGFN